MPSRRAVWVLGLVTGQAAAFWATAYLPGLGAAMWHHAASLVLALAVAVALRRPMARSRRFLAMGVLAFSLLATVSGFWLLYWKEGIRVTGFQDWGVFWHILWSWFAAIFFFQHTWINRVALGHFLRRSVATVPRAVLHVGAYVLVAAAFAATGSAPLRDWFTAENYIQLSVYTWLVATLPPYAAWAYVRARLAAAPPRGLARRLRGATRVRAGVDVALVPLAALAVLSGIPLTFLGDQMDAAGLKYASKYWHVAPSVGFAVLVFAHSIHVWGTMRAHWRAYGVAAGDLPDPRPAASRSEA